MSIEREEEIYLISNAVEQGCQLRDGCSGEDGVDELALALVYGT